MARKPKAKKSKLKKRGRKVKTIEDLEEDIKSKCLSIRSIIQSDGLKKLKELEPLVSKAMADEMGINHGRLLDKLRNPIKFSTKEIHRISYYVKADPGKFVAQVHLEIKLNSPLIEKLHKFRSIRDMKQYNPDL